MKSKPLQIIYYFGSCYAILSFIVIVTIIIIIIFKANSEVGEPLVFVKC